MKRRRQYISKNSTHKQKQTGTKSYAHLCLRSSGFVKHEGSKTALIPSHTKHGEENHCEAELRHIYNQFEKKDSNKPSDPNGL